MVALTAGASPSERDRCLAAGMDACLTKPVRPETLLKAIEEHVDARPAQSVAESDPASIASMGSHSSAIDETLLVELEQLGGKDFVLSLVEEFFSDADFGTT